ncbi:MAG TPA: TonB-dependent receptor [Thermoanaerobaculia bacterium]|jgi:iron complex outermembrane receptor protein|nr:TonB-dependent receptor [Thermoanaerobaculia bacterium]
MSEAPRLSPRAGASPRRRLLLAAAWLGLLAPWAPSRAAATPAEAPAPTPAELKQLPLEMLLDVAVTSATKRPQALSETAAAITVVTAEDLRRSGVRSLPEALRLAAGLHVARFDSRTWAISARGFNSQAANKLLVLIDGRSVYTPLFSGVFWDVQNPLLEDVERIEVVRGPGATLWGANAVNGVVNVITRHSADTHGDLAVLAAGDEERAFAAFRHGGTLGKGGNGHYRVYAQYDYRDALARTDGTSADDPLRIAQAGFRSDRTVASGDLTLQGDVYGGRIGHRVFDDTDVSGGNVLGTWSRHIRRGSDFTLRAYVDHTMRDAPSQFRERRDTLDLDLQHRWLRGRHDLLWGGGYRSSGDRVRSTPAVAWVPERETISVANVFVQDQVRLADRWRLQLGLRLEDQSTVDPEVLPALTLAWQLAPERLLWAGAGRAVRAPTRIDRDLRVPGEGTPVFVGNKDFQSEEAVAYELGYRMAAGPAAVLEAVAFYNDYDSLRTQEAPTASGEPVKLGNRGNGHIRGAGISGSWQALQRLRLSGSATVLRSHFGVDAGSHDFTRGRDEANDPHDYSSLRADVDLPRDFELDGWLRHVGRLPNPAVPGYTELDLRLGWRRPGGWELALVGQNLLHESHPEFGAEVTRDEVQRGVFAQVTWRH